jgi:phosphoglycerate dehydrogenase-like enzyme
MLNKAVVHITSQTFCKSAELVSQLSALGITPVLWDQNETLEIFLKEAKWLIAGTEKINQALLAEIPELRGISKYGVGTDNLDLDFLTSSSIQLSLHPGTNRLAVAEYALGFLLTGMHLMHGTSSRLKQKIWQKDGGQNLSSKTVGIIGFGNVGQELARLLKPFNCKILVNEIDQAKCSHPDDSIQFVDLATALRDSNAVSLHIPLTSQTRALINEDSLKQMKTNSVLVNTSRGEIVNEPAMISHLKDHIHFQYLADTHAPEPYFGELLELENFMGTPHSAGNSKEVIIESGKAAIRGIKKLIEEGHLKKN